jgi:predicted AAA+ superfamily ATPase
MEKVRKFVSVTSVIKYLKNEKRNLSTETLYNYLDFCKSVYLVNMIQRRNIIGKEILSSQNKIYMIDHGLRQAIYGNNQRDVNQILENIVCVELQRRGYNVMIGCIGTKEVDFCATKNEEVIYFQVTYLLASEETIEREFGSLTAIQDNYPKYVLSLDELDFSRDGIIHKNIVEWLLE